MWIETKAYIGLFATPGKGFARASEPQLWMVKALWRDLGNGKQAQLNGCRDGNFAFAS
jgi:hypothetical protein